MSQLRACGFAVSLFSCHLRRFHRSSVRPFTRSHYEVLGVNPKATQDEIKQAYYAKSKQLHPDSSNGLSEEESEKRHVAFVELKSAYDVLKSPQDRRAYDTQLIREAYQKTLRRDSISNVKGANVQQQYSQAWGSFWEKAANGYAPPHFDEAEMKRQEKEQWDRVVLYTAIIVGIFIAYNVAFMILKYRREKLLAKLVAKDEIARSFLRQREYAHQRNDTAREVEIAQLLKADIDEAYKRKAESFERNPNEIREEYRWMNAITNTGSSQARR